MEQKNNTRVVFDYKLKLLILKLHTEHKDLINSLKNDDYLMLQDTQYRIRDYFVLHQNELNIAGILKHHYICCPDFFALLCAVISDINSCENWDDVWLQLTKSNKENQTLYDSSGNLFEYVNYEEDLNTKIIIKCMCSHLCCPENMSIITNTYTNLRVLIACDCLEKTGIISSYEFKKKSKLNDTYEKIMFNKANAKLKKQSYDIKWINVVKKYIETKNKYRFCDGCGILNINKNENSYIKKCKQCYINNKNILKPGICYLTNKTKRF